MPGLSFNAIAAACPAAATKDKARRTTGGHYVGVATRDLHNAMTRAGWHCLSAYQGPSFKRAYIPYARHSLAYAQDDANYDAPHARVIVTNSHNGLSPLMFAPAWYVPRFSATLYASAFIVFHREFSEDGRFDDAVKLAMEKAIAAGPAVATIWNKLCRQALPDGGAAVLFNRILKIHAGTTVSISSRQLAGALDGAASTVGPVIAATLGGFLGGKFMAGAGDSQRKVYVPRAIMRMERASFGAWYEGIEVLKRAGYVPGLDPFLATPQARTEDGGRRASGAVIVTDTPATLDRISGKVAAAA